jgi:outer membrane autotransporter protein
MNGSIRHIGAHNTRTRATPEIAPIARAIRSALAVSATVLALSTGTVAHASACRPDTASGIGACDGAFIPSEPDIAPADLTRVDGGDHPGSVLASTFVDAGWGVAMLAQIDNITDLDVSGYGTDVRALDIADSTVVIDNIAAISAHAAPLYAGGDAGATGVWAAGDEIEIDNRLDAAIGATAVAAGGQASATAVHAAGNLGDVSIDNAGAIDATATGAAAIATGIQASSSLYGMTGILNSGDVAAHAYADTGFAQAVGIEGESQTAVDIANYGNIDVIASSLDDTAFAMGMYGAAVETTTLRNYGDATVFAESTHGDAMAYGAFEYAGPAGIGLMINGGDIQVEASAGAGAQAHATGINLVGDVASVFNDGSSNAIATAGDGGLADARAARAYGSYAAVSNYGSLAASANADGGEAKARGADSLGMLGATVYNAGDIQASATAEGGIASAFGSYSVGVSYGGYTTNNGTISAQARGDSASAYGTLNASAYYGDAITTNTGSISALAEGGVAEYGEAEAIAFGAYNFSLLYNSVVDNSGAISASASAMADISGTYGFLQAKAVGAEAISVYGYGETVIANSGDIGAMAETSQGYASAWGAVVQTTGLYGGGALIDNEGAISAHAHADIGVANAIGAYAINQMGDASVVNNGDISASARAERGIVDVSVNYAYATGVKESSYYGTVNIGNYGDIAALASGYGAITGARGIQASGANISIMNAAGASISATGEVDLFGGGFATGIEATGTYGIDIVNDGDIDAYGHAHAFTEGEHGFYGAARALGIYASAGFQGNVSVANNGDITATAIAEDSVSFAQGGAGATGINAYAKYDATIVNNGDIAATAQTEFGISAAYGVIGHGKYSTSVVNAAGASILAEASAGTSAGDAYGGRSVSFGTHVFGNGMDHGVVYNAGSIVSHATVTSESASPNPGIASAWGAAVGAYSNIQSGAVVNLGDIEATARADFGYATAYGSYILAGTAAATSNDGTIFASADAANGNAWSVGSFGRAVEQYYYVPCEVVEGPYGPYNSCDYDNARWVVTGGDAALDNRGSIAALARSEGGVGASYGAAMLGGVSARITNAGQISAIAEADDALAVGALANAFYGDATVANSGAISAVARGDIADAKGVHVLGVSGTRVDNSGTIEAGAYGADATATAVAMDSQGSNELTNTGTIAAFGDGARIAVWSGIDATARVANGGTLIGAVVTGDLDDSLTNAAGAEWLVVGTSDFGAGDDHIVNHGTILMDNAAIRLGSYADGNTFDNFGTLAVSGADNVLDMDNPFPVSNNGVISFIDGAPDDVLTVAGDFGGEGGIDLDVSGLNQAGDQLHIDGDVIDSSVQSLNVNLTDMPTSASDIALVTVDGASAAGNFVLGNVGYAPGFMTWDFRLNSHIDAAGSRDVFSLGIDATGLNRAGILAANVASGATNMLNAQVGTFKQRMGVNPYGDAGKVMSAFFRTYASEGDVNPARTASNFDQASNFAYDQSVWGREIGVNANLFGNFHAGLVLGNADGRQRLAGDGAGSNRMSGMTWGLYATWFAPQGFYVDVSGRWMAVDVASISIGQLRTRAHAGAWNLEAGYQWNLRGLSIVPQVQYTRTEVEDVRAMQAGGTTFESQGGTSARGRLGVELSKTFESGNLRWTPYGSIGVVREFDGDFGYTVAGTYNGATSTKGTSMMAELGLGMQVGGWGLGAGVHWIDGGAFKGTAGGQASVRFAW